MKRTRYAFFLSLCFIGIAALSLWAFAADHSEAPNTKADNAADITDIYAWHEEGKFITVINYAGLNATTVDQAAVYDENVLYTVHIDNNADQVADINIYIRFGKNAKGEWGVQVQNLPGSAGPISGPVGTILGEGSGLKVFTGLRDDPFFFDLEGFLATVTTGTLSFDNSRDSFAALNVSSIVLEMDLASAKGEGDTFDIWATTGRKD